MMEPEPVYLGQFGPMYHGAKPDRYIDIATELVTGETIVDVAFTVTLGGVEVPAVVSDSSVSGTRVDFRINAPATPGIYHMLIVFTISDGQVLPHTASLWVV